VNKLFVTAIAGLSVAAAPLAASAQPYGNWGPHNGGQGAQRSWSRDGGDRGWNRDRGDRGDNGGALLAAGAFGLILGAIISNAGQHERAQPYGYGNRYGYGNSYNSYNSYGYDQSDYRQDCGWQTQAYRDDWGRLAYQQVEVCR
jgi:Ni/Co efflux regulator RcnB